MDCTKSLSGLLLPLFFLLVLPDQSVAQRMFSLVQTHNEATVGLDRKGFGGPYSQGYHHDFDLGASVSSCERIVSVSLDVNIQSYNENIPPVCSRGVTFYNIYYGCGVYNGTGGSCPETNVIDAQNFPSPLTPYGTTYSCTLENFDFGGNLSADIVPVFDTGCPNGQDAINQGYVTYTYTITVTIETDLITCTSGGCLAGTTTVRSCDDGDPCTTGDIETILDCDGSVCLPCMGTPVNTSTVSTDFVSTCPDDGPIQLLGSTSATGSVITYDWTGPGGFSSSDPNPLTTTPGTYTLSVTVDGCVQDPASVAADYIDFNPLATVDDINPCFGEEITLSVFDVGGGANFTWFDAAANPIGTNNPQTVITNQAGFQNYLVRVDQGGCSTILSVPVNVAEEISAEIFYDPAGLACANESISFEAQMMGGGNFPAGWSFVWDNGAGSGPTYQRSESTPGSYVVDLEVTNPAGCSATFSEVFTVGSSPTVTLSPTNPNVCAGGSVVLTPSISGGNGPFSYLWGPNEGDNITTPTLTVDANSPETENIYVRVTDANGCEAISNLVDVSIRTPDAGFTLDLTEACAADEDVMVSLNGGFDANYSYNLSVDNPMGASVTDNDASDGTLGINFSAPGAYEVTLTVEDINDPSCTATTTETFMLNPPVDPPLLSCGEGGLDFLEINWTDVGADSYVVNIISAPPGATTAESDTTLTVTNLSAGDSVIVSVTAIQAGCPDVTSAEILCIAQSCDPVVPMITTPVDTFCVDGSAGLINLTVDVPAAGTVDWSGPGVTDELFDPAAAGSGMHTITVVYTEDGCTYSDDFELVVVAAPNVGVDTLDGTAFCAGDVGRFAPTGTLEPGATVSWIIPAGATVVDGDPMAFDTLTLQLGGAGPQMVSLAVNTPFCGTDTVGVDIAVTATPAPLQLDCANVSFDQVGFNWSHPTATGFTVTVLNQPAGASIVENAGSLLATGLAEGDSVTIRVTATIDAPCPDLERILTCTAASCPDITLNLDALGPFCAGDVDTLPLSTVVMGSDGSGSLSYLPGPGVIDTNFVPTGLVAGSYPVVASFTEGGCTFNDTTTVVINARPSANFTLDAMTVCTDSLVGADAGAGPMGWSYDWVVPAADATLTTNSATNVSVAWTTAGTRRVGLIVTDDNGCVSDTLFQNVEVVEPLPTPMISCETVTLSSVTFVWDAIPDALAYLVSVNGGAPFTQDSTSLVVSGLNPEEMVNLQLTAISNGPCGDSETATENCAADSCPNITVTGMGDQDLCAGSGSSVLALTATQTGGTGGGVFSFFGTGVTDNAGVFSFDADATGPGSYQINVRYDEGPCAGLDSFSITVTETPTSNFTLNGVEGPLTVCAGDDFGVAYVGPLTVADGATFDWEFAGAAATPLAAFENYTLNFATAGLYTLELTVTDNGCTSTTTRYEVRVEEPLMPPVITCTGSDLNSVTFSWDPVPGAADYELGDGTVLPGGQTSLTITGLLPGQDTTITLTARGPGVCGNAAPATSPSCSAEVCPTLTLDASGLMREVCLENGNEIIDLAAVLVTGGTGNGSYDFTGPGVTGTIFSAADAGGTETGTVHTVTVDYVEEGPCTFSGNFDLTVFSPPTATISAPAPACSNIGVQLTVGGFAGIMNNDITIDFDGGTVLDDGDATDNVYLVSWPTPGTKTVTAIVVRLPSSCASLPVTREVMIGEPLATPVVNCPPTAALESITFTWNAVPNALGYQVTLSSGETVTLDAATTSFLADGLDPETTVSISVVALGDGPCGNSESGQAVCETAPCPPGNVRAVTQDAAFCLDGNQSAFLLEAELNQGTPAGPFVWSGTGVVANGDGTFNFDPTGLGAGTYVLTVDYLGEANCSSSDNVTIELFDQPSSAFTATETLVCAGTETLVRVADAVDPTATYTWDFAGASQTAGPTTESYNLSWPSAGEYPVSLMVTANGCSATSTVMVTVESPADAGTPTGEVPEFCAGSAATINLNTLLVGQDAGGTWIVAANSPSSAGGVNISTGVFDGSQLSAGDYVFAYSVASGICPAATTEVSLRILAPPVADAGPPQLLTCTMGMATLDGTGSESGVGYTYRWFATDPEIVISGGDQPTLDVSQPGTYFLEVTNAIGCSNTAEVTVNAETDAPVMEVELRNVTCFGANDGTILVTNVRGGRPPFTFNLNGQDRGQTTSFAGLMAQEYSLRVTDANGCFSDLMLDLTEPEELNVQLQFSGDGTEVVVGDEITINAVVTGGGTLDTLIWAPDSIRIGGAPNTVTLTATQTQTIAVTVVDEFGCRATDRELLLVRREYPAYFPSAFSPNGDGTNDTFIIQGRPNMRVTSLTIYDRWGAEVHRGEDQTPGSLEHAWDGFVRGEEAAAGVYLYVAQVEFFDGTNQTFSGELLLLK